VNEISSIVSACILLHNMMVQVRMERGEVEGADWYETTGGAEEAGEDPEVAN
jgi:hypothetical protein